MFDKIISFFLILILFFSCSDPDKEKLDQENQKFNSLKENLRNRYESIDINNYSAFSKYSFDLSKDWVEQKKNLSADFIISDITQIDSIYLLKGSLDGGNDKCIIEVEISDSIMNGIVDKFKFDDLGQHVFIVFNSTQLISKSPTINYQTSENQNEEPIVEISVNNIDSRFFILKGKLIDILFK